MDCRTGRICGVPAELPKGFIKNTTGAGDAYCAGVLYGAHEDRSLEDSINGDCYAAFSLSDNGGGWLEAGGRVINFIEMC